jgi:hypothetical protein
MKAIKLAIAITGLPCLLGTVGTAQVPGGGQAGLNAAMLKLFEDIGGFTSKAEVRLQEKGSPEVITMTVDFAMRDGKARMDLDMGAVKSKQLPPEALAAFKVAGLDKLATIVRPDRKSTLLVYPAVQSYAETPMSKDELAVLDRKFRIEKTPLGREIIDRRSCEKNKVVVSADNGEKLEAIAWYAAELKNFPLKVQMEQAQMTVVLQYRDVKLTPPDAGRFEPPAGFTKHATVEHLMQNAMMRSLGVRK